MADSLELGTRLRNRRLDQGLKQGDVARTVGISPAYLNLIEHNRRRIGGRLLIDLANVLDVDLSALEQEVSDGRLRALRNAAQRVNSAGAELGRADEYIARFPGWASVVDAQDARIRALEGEITALRNRLAHDVDIAAALHEVISTATAIRSTATILSDSPDLDSDWQMRFHKNIDVESARLAQSSQDLLLLLQKEAEREHTSTDPAVSP